MTMENNDIMIRVENASVRFNMASEKIDSLKEYAVKLVRRELMFKEFFALRNIDLTVRRGESWAFVGRNGAGKSTLLKLISRILMPYEGKVTVNGSIAPMIELGAGFDPNLTAEENIFINGCIMGHSKKFMQEHFDEIVEFAQLQDFLKMPIKNYSSGMRARLGFAVATMVKPDILIVDEVLAVGDAAFRKRCNQRMKEMLSDGTTLLFVSHSNADVRALCLMYPAFVLHDDALAAYPQVEDVPETYPAFDFAPERSTISRAYNLVARRVDPYALMPAYPGQVLIVHGDADAIVPLTYAQRAQTTVWHARLEVLTGADHGLRGDYLPQAVQLATEFLAASVVVA